MRPLSYLFPPFRLVPHERRLLCGESPIRLGSRAFDMLLALVERRERVVSKDELFELVWPRLVVEENNLAVQVATLRKVLGHPVIATVPGRGYRFMHEVSVEGEQRAAAPPAAAAVAPTTATADHAPPPHRAGNLPHWLPALYGRDEDLGLLAASLRGERLVTIVGPAGIGKTRLAQAAAHAAAADHVAVWWVDLGSLADGDLLPGVVATNLGVPLDGGRDPVAATAAALPAGDVLVVLDNAEHLLSAVGEWVGRMRALAPRLRLLVTSQEVLHVVDERALRIGPLSLPAEDSAAAMAASGAVALFVARAQAADRRFVLDDHHRSAVADICRQLDGIPLAIELAAARLRLLGVAGLRARLDQRLQVLTSGDRGALRRQRTLREALDWSYQLLSEPERKVLRRLGVFAGGFTLAAAQQVGSDMAGAIDDWDVIDLLGALIDKSLVIADGSPEPRYRLLETTRLFALERLIEHGDAAAARNAHRLHFVELAERAAGAWHEAGAQMLSMLDLERDNLLLALAWTEHDDDGLLGLRLATAMTSYWVARGLAPRGLQAARATLAQPGIQGASGPRCRVECDAASLCWVMGRHDEGAEHAGRALALARELGDVRSQSAALHWVGAFCMRGGQIDAACEAADESLRLAEASGDAHTIGIALVLVGTLAERQGRRAEARALVQRHLQIREGLGHPGFQLHAQLHLARLSLDVGDHEAALSSIRAAHALEPVLGSEYALWNVLATAAQWAAATARSEWAVLLDAARSAQASRSGLEDRADAARAERLARLREALAPDRRHALEAAGRALGPGTVQQAVGRLLVHPDSPAL